MVKWHTIFDLFFFFLSLFHFYFTLYFIARVKMSYTQGHSPPTYLLKAHTAEKGCDSIPDLLCNHLEKLRAFLFHNIFFSGTILKC
jgi:hypothetical protein